MQASYAYLGGGGRIVNVLSTMSRGADTRGAGLVAACEEAIRTISRTAAVEWGRDGIRVNALGVPLTNADADAVASVAVFLASPASRYITGSLMIADGGRTIIR
jgi:NAD(P)-dependent dehydrogenase (short-subunit alcohol dehydrogenase family)